MSIPIEVLNNIPHGHYCYGADEQGNTKLCPYWERVKDKPEQQNGYCVLLGYGDWERNTLLWDQVKECGYNIKRT